MTSAPEGLPRPTAGAVTVYFLGPGFGESQVVVLPDDRVLVVDGCSREGVNHPEALLRALGRTRIDLLVLTHPDLDHLKGVAHHGSEGAYWPEAWEGHAAPEKTAAVIAPFASSGLPREGPLRRLREHCDRLGVSADAGGAFQRAEAAGWSRGDDAVFDWSLPCIVATVTAAGPVRFARSATAALFR